MQKTESGQRKAAVKPEKSRDAPGNAFVFNRARPSREDSLAHICEYETMAARKIKEIEDGKDSVK